MRRLLLIVIVLVVLAVLVLVAAQVVLWSDLPRRLVVAELQERLGLEVEIDSLRARWSGHADARGIRVSLPLEDKPFLEAHHLQLKHTSIPRLLLTRDVEVETLLVDQPVVRLVEQPDGRWNLQQVQEVLAANLARARDPDDPTRPLPVPELLLRDARLDVTRYRRETVELRDVRIVGERLARLGYRLHVAMPRVGEVEARFSRAAPYTHEVRFDIAPEQQLVEELVEDLLGPTPGTRLAGTWSGRITAQELRGTVELRDVHVGEARIGGTAHLSGRTDTPTLVLEPIDLAFTLEPVMPEPVRMVGGRLLVTQTHVRLQNVHLGGFEGRARVGGELDLETLTGELSATWEDVTVPEGVAHRGGLDLRLTRHGPTRRRVEADVETRGTSELGDWDAELELRAEGERYDALSGTLRGRAMRYELRGRSYRLADLDASFATDGSTLAITRFALGEPDTAMHVTGEGELDWRERRWSTSFTGAEMILPAPAPPVSRLRVRARGDAAMIELEEAEVVTPWVEFDAAAAYAFAEPEPLSARVSLRQVPVHVTDDDLMLVTARNLVGELTARGTLQPLDLTAEGELLAEAVQVHRERLGDIDLRVRLRADESTAAFEADAVEWLGGDWQVRALYDLAEQRARLFVDATDVDLSLADGLIDPDLAVEVGRADLSLEAEDVELGRQRMHVTGEFEIRELQRGPVVADRVTGRIELAQGRGRVHDLLAVSGEGRVRGEAGVDLYRPNDVSLDVTLDDWPVAALPNGLLDAWVSGRARGAIDVAGEVGDADVQLMLQLASGEVAIGQVNLHAGLSGSVVRLHSLDGRTLRGYVRGQGQVDLHDRWRTAELEVEWADLQPVELEPWLPALDQMTGMFGGSLAIAPAEDRRALGPLRASLSLTASDAAFRDLPVGDGQGVAYIDGEAGRVVLDNLIIEMMGGHLSASGRVSQRPDGERFLWGSASLANIDMEMLSETFRPDEGPLLGRLDADLSLSTSLDNWRTVFGSGTIALRESDIASIPLISVLYDVANVVLVGRQPAGRGQGSYRFEEGAVLIERFFYQNRGLTIRLAGRADDLFAGFDSPFTGVASLTVAPLPDVEFLEVLNEAFVALQADVTTVRLGGRINEPATPQVVPFRGLWEAVRRVLGIRGE